MIWWRTWWQTLWNLLDRACCWLGSTWLVDDNSLGLMQLFDLFLVEEVRR